MERRMEEGIKRKRASNRMGLWGKTPIVIDRVAGEIIRLVASVCVSVRLSLGAVLFEPFDL